MNPGQPQPPPPCRPTHGLHRPGVAGGGVAVGAPVGGWAKAPPPPPPKAVQVVLTFSCMSCFQPEENLRALLSLPQWTCLFQDEQESLHHCHNAKGSDNIKHSSHCRAELCK